MNSTTLSTCSLSILQLIQNVVKDSGKGLYHRGQYLDCIETPQMKYSLVEFGIGGVDTLAFVGLCLPDTCSDQLIKHQIDNALKTLKSPFSVFSLASHTQDYWFNLNWVSYLTIFILVLIGLVSLTATIKVLSKKMVKKEQNKYIRCFNIVDNIQNHFKVREGQPLNIFDGVRAISMMWVAFGHVFSFFLAGGIENMPNYTYPTQKPFLLLVIMGLIAVDIFFALGGFFLAFVILRQKKITAKFCLMGVLQRALRIWPAYILVMLFYYSIFMRLGSGMFWSRVEQGTFDCNSMWRQILFISNFVDNGDHQCLGWGWYLQVDFQLFILGLLLLYVYLKSKKIFLATSILLSILSVIFNFVYSYHLDLRLFTDLEAFANFQDYMLYLYMKPYGRWTPYIIGLILGVYYMEFKSWLKHKKEQHQNFLSKIRVKFLQNSKLRKTFQWIGIALMAFLTFIPRPLQTGSTWPQTIHSLYWALSKPIFIIALFMVVIPTALGIKRSFFELILNSRLLMVIARISFCTYLVHLMVIYQVIYVQNNDFYYDLTTMFVIYIGILVLSLLLGFLLTILVEVPFSNLLKIIMKRRMKRDSQKVDRSQKQSLLTTTESLLMKQSLGQPGQRQSIN